MNNVEGGTCKSCRQPLVRTDNRTYHPAVTYRRVCPSVLQIVGRYYSFDVEPHRFIPDGWISTDEIDAPRS